MKCVLKLVSLTFAAVTITLAACAAPTAEETDESGAAASEGAPASQADYVTTPFLDGASIKAWIVRGDTAASAEIAKLWVSRDGAFTMKSANGEASYGWFKVPSATTMSLRINDGRDKNAAPSSPVEGSWSFAPAGGNTITLSSGHASRPIVLTAAP